MNITNPFDPEFNGPLDSRLDVANQSDRERLDGKYRGMVVFQQDDGIRYLLMPINSTNLEDALNRVDEATYNLVINTPVALTYAEIEALVLSNSLVIGKEYIITDHVEEHAMIQVTPVEINTGTLEPLTIKAKSSNSFYEGAVSDLFADDYIEYDFNNNAIGDMSNDIGGYWEDGIDGGDTITMSNITANSFEINAKPVIDGNFYIYFEDDSGAYDEISWKNSDKYSIEDIGAGNYRITVVTHVDLLDPAYNYGEFYTSVFVQDRMGKITLRRNIKKNIQREYDFRNYKVRMYKTDQASIAWNAGVTYARRQSVSYNNVVYVSASDGNIGNTPTRGGTEWIAMMRDRDERYDMTNRTYAAGGSGYYIPKDMAEFRDFYVFSDFNPATGIVTFNLGSSINNKISLGDWTEYDNNVMVGGRYTDTDLKAGSVDNLFRGTRVQSNNILENFKGNRFESEDFQGNSFGKSFSYWYFMARVVDNVIYSNCLYGVAFGQWVGNKDFTDTSSCFFSSTFGTNKSIGSFSNNSLKGPSFLNDFGQSFSQNETGINFERNTFASFATNNTFGDYCKANILGPYYRHNHVGEGFEGNNAGYRMQYNNIGDDFSFNTIASYFGGEWNTGSASIGDNFSNNIVGNGFGVNGPNTIGDDFHDNTIGNGCRNWNITGSTYDNTFMNNVDSIVSPSNNLRVNIFTNGVLGVNLTGATHVYNSYSCELFRRVDSNIRLKYVDNTDNTVIVGANT